MRTEREIRDRLFEEIKKQKTRGEYDSRDMAYDYGIVRTLQWVLQEEEWERG